MPDTAALVSALTTATTIDDTARVVTGLGQAERAAVFAALRMVPRANGDVLKNAVLALAGALRDRDMPIDEFAVALLHAQLPQETVRVIDVTNGYGFSSARLQNTRAVALMMQGLIEDAIRSFEDAIRLDPTYDVPLGNLANAYVTTGQLARAETVFARLISTPRVRPTVFANLARLRLLQRRFEDALEACRAALAIDDRCAQAHVNACCTFYEKGEISASIASGRRAADADINFPEAWYYLGRSFMANGEEQAAVECFEKALRLREEYLEASYALAVLGKTDHPPKEMPRPLVQRLFDEYSEYYDAHLQESLHYAVPSQLAGLFLRAGSPLEGTLDVADVGCGTGLTGLVFRPFARSLVGIDVSPGMLRASRLRGIYSELHLADACEYLATRVSAFDLVVAGDAVAYMGSLDGLFASAKNALRRGGFLLLSAEEFTGTGYALSRSGRFQHSLAYLEEQASGNGFEAPTIVRGSGRTEADVPVPCLFFVAKQTEKSHERRL